jgi:TusA-related sulfurtransferase
MIFDKEETKNLLNMIRSSDNENAVVAFEALKGVHTEKYLGELIVLYKYGKRSIKEWEEACPGCEIAIRNAVNKFTKEDGVDLSTGSCLSAMIEGKASNESIELFMELFTENMIGFLGQMGYPADKFEINIKLKDNGQVTKS